MKFKSLAAVATALLFPMAVWAVPVSVSILPAVQTVGQGSDVTVTVRIDGLLGAADQLSAYDLRITFDTALLSYVSQSFLAQTQMGDPSAFDSLETFAVVGGTATDQVGSFLFPVDLASAQAGTNGFDLFSLTFKASNVDAFTNIAFAMVPNYSAYVLGNNNGNPLDATYTGACIGIGAGVCGEVTAPVPEPETYSLMALGLLVAGIAGRRAKRRAQARSAAV
jgi:PEP-CTERM motif-containing protein/cohesin domain-containing protein